VNERQAWLRGDGAEEGFELDGCSYWSIIGLHVSEADNNVGNTYTGDVIAIFNSSHIVLRRNIADHPNRCGNVHPITLESVTNSLVVENEAYYFHRWGIMDLQWFKQ